MELNREQTIKALECCARGRKSKDDRPCLDCPYNECNIVGGTSERQLTGTCQGRLMKDALALIKELTEENDKLYASYTKLTRKCASLSEENERLKDDKDYWKNRTKGSESEYDQAVKRGYNLGKVDSVRSFAVRLKARRVSYGNITFEVVPIDDIDQIAKEMVEGEVNGT